MNPESIKIIKQFTSNETEIKGKCSFDLLAFSVCLIKESHYLAAFSNEKKIIVLKINGENFEEKQYDTKGKTNISCLYPSNDFSFIIYSSESVLM